MKMCAAPTEMGSHRSCVQHHLTGVCMRVAHNSQMQPLLISVIKWVAQRFCILLDQSEFTGMFSTNHRKNQNLLLFSF